MQIVTRTDIKPGKARSQAERRAKTKGQLLDAARALFVEKGFAETGTPELVRQAGVTRGALYHHFEDKTDLFRHVAEQEAQAIAETIEQATDGIKDPLEAMRVGTDAYFEAMAVPGRAKLLLADAAAVMGHEETLTLTRSKGSQELKNGLARAMPYLTNADLDAMTNVLSAAFDRAALEIAQGSARQPYTNALFTLIKKAMA
ncbi:MAG: helix-turn-helix domain-containing protein [Pseudomonadota bacterium]